ncbi:DgyrCDS162 [Dimorphilus gyrociliatus]|uniref:DgyrCDS162 n=1 Tax=Dimorphilus gyrociliatus TaxID=2664684 RepID=A0A7I8V5H4_9ANNE|nr:DgyrCDS162 [Dimorphilus gyrociliatus]
MKKNESVCRNSEEREIRKRTSRSQEAGSRKNSHRVSKSSGSKSRVRKTNQTVQDDTVKKENSKIHSPPKSQVEEKKQEEKKEEAVKNGEEDKKGEESTLKRSEPFIAIQKHIFADVFRHRSSPEVKDEVLLSSCPFDKSENEPQRKIIPWEKYKPPQNLLPFFICHKFTQLEQAILDLDELWFRSHESIAMSTGKSFKTVESELYQMMDQDSVLNLLIEQKKLEDNSRKKEFEFQTAIKGLHDIKQQLKVMDQLNNDRKPMSTVASIILDRKSTSVMSSKWMMEDAKSSASALIKKYAPKQEKSMQESKVSIKKASTESVKIIGRQWSIAKNNRMPKEERKDKSSLMIEELNKIKKQNEMEANMPIADFFINPPPFQPEMSHSDQINALHDEYIQQWHEYVTNDRQDSKRTFKLPRIKFLLDPISYMNNPNTGRQILLGISRRSVLMAATCQINSNIYLHSNLLVRKGTMENWQDLTNKNVQSVIVTVKLYKKSVRESTIFDLIREAQILDYVGQRTSAVPKFIGLLKVAESEQYLPFAIATVLFGDADDLGTISLEKLLLTEISRRKEGQEVILENWRYYPDKGWTAPKISNFGRAYILDGFSDKSSKGLKGMAEKSSFRQYSMSFESDIFQLGYIIKQVDLSLNLGLDGIVRFCQSTTSNDLFWSTCDIADALEGAMAEMQALATSKGTNRKSSMLKFDLFQTVCPCLNY